MNGLPSEAKRSIFPRFAGVAAGVLATLIACSSSDLVTPRVPPHITVVAGDKQSGVPGQALATPLTIALTAADGSPLAGDTISWSVVTGSGSLSATSVVTDVAGGASVTWILGNEVGPQSVKASVRWKTGFGGNGVSNFDAPFTATVVPPQLSVVSGDSQTAMIGRFLPQRLAIAVIGPSGAGVPGLAVEWKVMTGGGQFSESSSLTDAQGQAWATWRLGATPGVQSVAATVTGFPSSSATFSAIAAHAPIVLHYDGMSWSTSLEDVNGTYASLASVWGATASAVLSVGSSCGNGIVLRFDGSSWGQPPASCVGNFFSTYPSVWGNSASDVFIVTRNGIPPKLGGGILHYDGQQLNYVYTDACPQAILCPSFQAVWNSSPTDAFAVGDAGTIAHYDGTNWNQQTSGTTSQLSGVWGIGPTSAVFAVGAAGTILSYDRSTWSNQTSGTTQPLYAVWGTTANDIFVVGGAGTILHYDGTAWTAQNSGTTQSLYGVWGIAGNDVFAVGDASTILHYDGTSWTPQTTAASMNLRGIGGTSSSNVFAVGAPR
jgi:hypothetical protein